MSKNVGVCAGVWEKIHGRKERNIDKHWSFCGDDKDEGMFNIFENKQQKRQKLWNNCYKTFFNRNL